MSLTRVPFDPAATFVVACEELVIAASEKLRRGAPFPWRELGIEDEHQLYTLWLGLKIDVTPTAEFAVPALPGPTLQTFHVAPGETVSFAPPPARPAKKPHQSRR